MSDVMRSDASGEYLLLFINQLDRRPARVIVVGGSAEFVAELASWGYFVLYIDKDPAELEKMSALIDAIRPSQDMITFLQFDVEQWGGVEDLTIQNNDCVVFCRTLHHMQDPARAIRNVRERISDGVTVIVADLTTELSSLILEQEENDKETIRTFYASGDPDAELPIMEEEWRANDALNQKCHAMISSLGFYDESDVQSFLEDVSQNNSFTLYYTLPCPCGQWSCAKKVWYWFAILE